MKLKQSVLFFFFMVFGLCFVQATNLATPQIVKASFYASKFHKRKAASGEIYHKDSMVCAHKTLPFGTILEVRNPQNNKYVVVRVIDRGPFIKGRTLDLSYAAAKELGIIQQGVATIEIKRYVLESIPTIRYQIIEGLEEELKEIPLLEFITARELNQSKMKNTTLTMTSI